MSEETAKVVVDEQPTAAEKEERVLEAAGIDTKASDGTYKVDLRKNQKQEKDAVQKSSTKESVLGSVQQSEESGQDSKVGLQEVGEGNEKEAEVVLERIEDTEEPPINEGKEEDLVTKQDVIEEASKTNEIQLPENIQKVVDFMNETGGSLEDYVRLNTDYKNINESTLLYEYYKQTKSHLDKDEIDFLIEDSFAFDEDIDEEKDIKEKS